MTILLLAALSGASIAPGEVADSAAPSSVTWSEERVLEELPAPGTTNGAQARPGLRLEASESSVAAAQPSARQFLYHVLLTAVSALVTALIWKAIL